MLPKVLVEVRLKAGQFWWCIEEVSLSYPLTWLVVKVVGCTLSLLYRKTWTIQTEQKGGMYFKKSEGARVVTFI